ncbi:MAG TPA: elongation factor P [Candidatus Hydrogenedentes bacterium]|nr:elongation factor P [Candidatus Hydrogenedentota bacterium]HPG66793.1 elongation factor P [Candidatus Hydrogenedentota bacterium]
MISTADFRNGMVIVLDNDLWEIVDFQHVKPGKGGAFVRTKLKNVLTARVLEKTFRSGERMEEARIEEQVWQFLYSDGDFFHFMHPETYEQLEVGQAIVGDGAKWLKENATAKLIFYQHKVIRFEPAIFVELKVTRSDPGIQGDRASGATKPATLETGATIQVPLFIEEGDVLKVDTRTSAYIERVNR